MRILLVVLALAVVVGQSAGQSVKLNGQLALGSDGGDVLDFAPSRDGAWVAFRAEQPAGTTSIGTELFAMPADGSIAPQFLEGGSGNIGPIAAYGFSPANDWLVYFYEPGLGAPPQLHSAPTDGSAPARALTNFPLGGGVFGFLVSPDSSLVFYEAVLSSGSPLALYSRPINGGIRRVVGQDVPGGGFFFLTPDSSQVVLIDAVTSTQLALFTRATSGGPRIQISPVVPAGHNVSFLRLNFAGDLVVYRADQDIDGVEELYSVPVDGSAAPIKLHGDFVAGENVLGYRTSPTEDRVVYRADLGGALGLFSAPLDASSPPVNLSGSFVSGGAVLDYAFDPSGSRIVYRADQDTDGVSELYSVPSDGSSAAVKLSLPLPSGGDVVAFEAGVAHVIFRADQFTDNMFEVFSVPIDGSSAAVRLNPMLGANRDVGAFDLAPEGTRVAYQADQAADDVFELFTVPADASAPPVRVNGDLPAGGDVTSAFVLLAGDRVVYGADEDEDEEYQLYTAPADGSEAPDVLNPPLPPIPVLGDVFGFAIASTGTHVVYRGRESATFDIFTVAFDAPRQSTRLNASGNVSGYELTPDGGRAIYQGNGTGPIELYSAPTDASAQRVRLNDPLVAGGEVTGFTITSDSATVVYRADQLTDQDFGLFAVPGDGSGSPVTLASGFEFIQLFVASPDGARIMFLGRTPGGSVLDLYSARTDGNGSPVALARLVAGQTVVEPAFAPDSQRVVYRLREGVTERLFSIQADGSAAAIELNDPLPAGGSVHDFEIAASATFVVYRADQTIDNVDELYRVPIDGSGPPQVLNPPLNAGGDVTDFALSPNGMFAVYRADRNVNEVFHVFAVPADGSGVAVRLSGPHVDGGDASDFRISPDSRWVVYRADQEENNRFDLYSRRINGNGGPFLLNGPLVQLGDVTAEGYTITPDSRRVVYLADQITNNIEELFSAPINRSGVSLRHCRIDPGRFLSSYAIAPDSSRVVYTADQELDNVVELFTSEFTPPHQRSDEPDPSGVVWAGASPVRPTAGPRLAPSPFPAPPRGARSRGGADASSGPLPELEDIELRESPNRDWKRWGPSGPGRRIPGADETPAEPRRHAAGWVRRPGEASSGPEQGRRQPR